MATKFPPGQDMENISPKDLEEAKQYTKERKAYKDASQIGPDRGVGDVKGILGARGDEGEDRFLAAAKKMQAARAANKAAAADRASRVNEMGDTYKKGGKVSSASSRADGICIKGKTRGKMV
jgi:hypothetical protein